jgi:histidyl-tRNA synthetase
MAAEGLRAAGLPAGKAVLKINNRKLLDGLLNEQGVMDAGQKLIVLRALDKFDRLGWAGVQDLLGAGRLDESGDFTKGAGLPNQAIAQLEAFMAIASSASLTRSHRIDALARSNLGERGEEALRELAAINDALAGLGVTEQQAIFDPSVVRGLEYYTGAVFEAELLLETLDDKGNAVRFGSIGGGGRYDDLVARFTGQVTPATGFSFGVSRLASALRAAGQGTVSAERGPVVIIAFDEAAMADYFAAAAELRAAGIAAEVYLGSSGMRPQMKYADRRLAPAAVILGGDEIAAGTVTIKDLDLGRELSAKVSDNAEWREQRPGQVNVPRGELVAQIRRILEAGR